MQSMIELFGWSKPDHRDINMAVFKFENATGCHFEWRKKMATIVVWRHQSIPWLLRPVHCSPLRFFWYPSLFQQSKGRGKILIFEYFPSPLRAFYYRYFSFIIFFLLIWLPSNFWNSHTFRYLKISRVVPNCSPSLINLTQNRFQVIYWWFSI